MMTALSRRIGQRGFTLAELVLVVALVALLTTMALPVAKFSVKRRREEELREALRTMRTAIDDYKHLSDQGQIPLKLGSEGYPPDLDTLVKGVDLVGQLTKRKFMRRIPKDPMTGETEWGLRSYQDEPDSDTWGGDNVYDVYSKSDATAIDGTKYKDW
jgi:general secretion pathway protein G